MIKDLRENSLSQIEKALEVPMIILAFIWLVLTVVDLTTGLSPFLVQVSYLIWGIFWLDFIIEFTMAPAKIPFLKRSWLTILALIIPAIRVLRVIRAFRAIRLFRGTYLIRILGTFNRGMKALGSTLGRRGFGYVLVLTLVVILLGAAGIYAIEHENSTYITDFGTAVWWSSMMITTMGSDYFPTSPEGRMLSFVLAIYGFAVFGYVTATVASFFVDRDAESEESPIASNKKLEQIENELKEIKKLLKEKTTS